MKSIQIKKTEELQKLELKELKKLEQETWEYNKIITATIRIKTMKEHTKKIDYLEKLGIKRL